MKGTTGNGKPSNGESDHICGLGRDPPFLFLVTNAFLGAVNEIEMFPH